MTDGTNRYCDLCWAVILDRGYVDRTDLCESCLSDVDGWDELVDVCDLEQALLAQVG